MGRKVGNAHLGWAHNTVPTGVHLQPLLTWEFTCLWAGWSLAGVIMGSPGARARLLGCLGWGSLGHQSGWVITHCPALPGLGLARHNNNNTTPLNPSPPKKKEWSPLVTCLGFSCCQLNFPATSSHLPLGKFPGKFLTATACLFPGVSVGTGNHHWVVWGSLQVRHGQAPCLGLGWGHWHTRA